LDVKEDGIHSEPSTSGQRGTNCTFENLHIQNIDGNGISINQTPFESIIHWAFVRAVGGYQIDLVGVPRMHISQNHLGGENGGNSMLRIGPGCNFMEVVGNWFSAVFSDTSGIEIWASDEAETYEITIVGNVMDGHSGYGGDTAQHDGIYLHTMTVDKKFMSVKNIVITGNIIEGFRYGINLASNTVKWTLIDGNNLAGNVAGAINDLGTGTLIGDNLTETS
jgi:hypothetical protein